jgi:predicted enzyme related to lactoylglutathione lyase
VEQAKALGGKVLLPPIPIEGTGKFTLIQDPQGATFCAIEYTQPS